MGKRAGQAKAGSAQNLLEAPFLLAILVVFAGLIWTATAPSLCLLCIVLVIVLFALAKDRQHLIESQAASGCTHKHQAPSAANASNRSTNGTGNNPDKPFRSLGPGSSAREVLEQEWGVPQEVAVELGGVVELTLDSFISPWYTYISEDVEVPHDIRLAICQAIGSLVGRLRSRLHLLSFAVDKGLLAVQLHLRWYSQVRRAAAERNPKVFAVAPPLSDGLLLTEEQQRCLLEEFSRSKRLHGGLFSSERWRRLQQAKGAGSKKKQQQQQPQPASGDGAGKAGEGQKRRQGSGAGEDVLPLASLMQQQPDQLLLLERSYLRSVASVLVRRLLPDKDTQCNAVRHLCRELLGCTILQNVAELLASPDNITAWLLLALQSIDQQQPTGVGEIDGLSDSIALRFTPGVVPSGFPDGEGWRHFAGCITEGRAEQLLLASGQAATGTFLIRKVSESDEPDLYELHYLVQAEGGARAVRGCKLRLSPLCCEYAERDAFFFQHVLVLAEPADDLDSLLWLLRPLAHEGMDFRPSPASEAGTVEEPEAGMMPGLGPEVDPLAPQQGGGEGEAKQQLHLTAAAVPQAVTAGPVGEPEEKGGGGEERLPEALPSAALVEQPTSLASTLDGAVQQPTGQADEEVPQTAKADEALDGSQLHALQRQQHVADLQAAVAGVLPLLDARSPTAQGEGSLAHQPAPSSSDEGPSAVGGAERLLRVLEGVVSHGVRGGGVLESGKGWDALFLPDPPVEDPTLTGATKPDGPPADVAPSPTAKQQRDGPLPPPALSPPPSRASEEAAPASLFPPVPSLTASLFPGMERRRSRSTVGGGEEDFFTGSSRWLSGLGSVLNSDASTSSSSSSSAAASSSAAPPPSTSTPATTTTTATSTAAKEAVAPVATEGAAVQQAGASSVSPATGAEGEARGGLTAPWTAFSPKKTLPASSSSSSTPYTGRRPSFSSSTQALLGNAAGGGGGALLKGLLKMRPRRATDGPRGLVEVLLEAMEAGSLPSLLAGTGKDGLEDWYEPWAAMRHAETRTSLLAALAPLQDRRVLFSPDAKARVLPAPSSGSHGRKKSLPTVVPPEAGARQPGLNLDALMDGFKKGPLSSMSVFGGVRQRTSDSLTTPASPPSAGQPPLSLGSPLSASALSSASLVMSSWTMQASSAGVTQQQQQAVRWSETSVQVAADGSTTPHSRTPLSSPALSPRGLHMLELSTSLSVSMSAHHGGLSSFPSPADQQPFQRRLRPRTDRLTYTANSAIAEAQRLLVAEAERAAELRFSEEAQQQAGASAAADGSSTSAGNALLAAVPIMRLFGAGVSLAVDSARRGSGAEAAGRQARLGSGGQQQQQKPTAGEERERGGSSATGGGSTDPSSAQEQPAHDDSGARKKRRLCEGLERPAFLLQHLLSSAKRLHQADLAIRGIWREPSSEEGLRVDVSAATTAPTLSPPDLRGSLGPAFYTLTVTAPAPPTQASAPPAPVPAPSTAGAMLAAARLSMATTPATAVGAVVKPAPVWQVRRRYSDCQRLDRQLRSQISARLAARLPPLPPTPSQALTSPKTAAQQQQQQQDAAAEQQRQGVARYLQQLLEDPLLGSSFEVTAFLTAGKTMLTQDDEGGVPGSRAAAAGKKSFLAGGSLKVEMLEERLFGLMEEAFDLDNIHVLRRQAITIIKKTARAFFSGTINKRLVAEYEALTSVQSFARMFNGLRRYLWPSGVFYTPALLPSEEEKARQRVAVLQGMVQVAPVALGKLTGILGQECAEQGLLRVLEALQCPLLLKNLAYCLLDLLLLELFPQDPEVTSLLHGLTGFASAPPSTRAANTQN